MIDWWVVRDVVSLVAAILAGALCIDAIRHQRFMLAGVNLLSCIVLCALLVTGRP